MFSGCFVMLCDPGCKSQGAQSSKARLVLPWHPAASVTLLLTAFQNEHALLGLGLGKSALLETSLSSLQGNIGVGDSPLTSGGDFLVATLSSG